MALQILASYVATLAKTVANLHNTPTWSTWHFFRLPAKRMQASGTFHQFTMHYNHTQTCHTHSRFADI